ncbi:MAG: hypothetical protein NTV43_18135, partial [Methylococcales bacterium]|nr:hypothetical protein [Methylococcales bacterium]
MALDIAHTVLATTRQRLKPLHSSVAPEAAVFTHVQTALFRPTVLSGHNRKNPLKLENEDNKIKKIYYPNLVTHYDD